MSEKKVDMPNMSQKLSEVMDDIGVNERIVKKRRRAYKIIQTINSILADASGRAVFYFMGSQIEGSTTLGLNSVSGLRLNSSDVVFSLYCKSLPHQVLSWIQKQGQCKWPIEDVLIKCRQAGCLVVGVGSKVSDNPELEWRISTHLQERHIMLGLNIPQINCYIVMKMFLKTHIDPHVEKILSSYMCKNVLWYCISESPDDWHSGSLLLNIQLCLSRLRTCVIRRNCPHFIISENNLRARRMSESQRSKILELMDNVINNNERLLCGIQIDDLGRRLQIKLNRIPHCSNIPTATKVGQKISYDLVQATFASINLNSKNISTTHANSYIDYLSKVLSNIIRYSESDDVTPYPDTDIEYLHATCKLLIPRVSSKLGSMLASRDIGSNRAVSDRAFQYLEKGKTSDVLSGRLKLLSVLYCTGDMKRAEIELSSILEHYQKSPVTSCCQHYELTNMGEDFMKVCDEYNEDTIVLHTAVCTIFEQSEIHCVPHELKFELLKTLTEEDKLMRQGSEMEWMDNIVVDSVPYLHFLEFKIHGQHHRIMAKAEALTKLLFHEYQLIHKDTYLNLVGQCWESENFHEMALICYSVSLHHRRHNNAARFLLCLLLYKLWKRNNVL